MNVSVNTAKRRCGLNFSRSQRKKFVLFSSCQPVFKYTKCLLCRLFIMRIGYKHSLELGRSQMNAMVDHIAEILAEGLCIGSFGLFIVIDSLVRKYRQPREAILLTV